MALDSLPVLYSFRRCPYAIRARMALAVSEISCQLREVDLRNRPAELYQSSGKGTVPVLVISKRCVLEESLEIMKWSLRKHDPEDWLWPLISCPGSVDRILQACDHEFKFHLDRYKYPNRFRCVEIEDHRGEASKFLRTLDRKLERHPFLFGEQKSFVDVAVAPFVRQFAFADLDWFRAQPWDSLHAWLQLFLDSVLFETIMEKRQVWKPGSSPLIEDWKT